MIVQNIKMTKIKITKEMLEGQGDKILGQGITTDEQINLYGWGDDKKQLKFVVCKGFIDDWCIYVESMEEDQNYEQVKNVGNKIHNRESIKLLVDCDDEVLSRYRN